ncbi:FKBP-type 16 kDa peptidyl-prolyl cis-trans isomerase [archaeon]|nr:FKBP-type 16 kDa peptidyl-prolyl cis-trans isomerase [archaeon]
MSEEIDENVITLKVHYTGKLKNGEVFDSSIEEIAKEAGIYNPSRDYEPLEVKLGSGQLIPGFEKALMNMKAGEKKEVTIPPEEGYGHETQELFNTIKMEVFKDADIEPEIGMLLETDMGVGVVHEIKEDEVTLNFNHPLTGKTLIFIIEVVEILE